MFRSFLPRTLFPLTLGLLASACATPSPDGSAASGPQEAEVTAAATIVTFEAGELQWGKTVVEISADGKVKRTVVQPGVSTDKPEPALGKEALAALEKAIEAVSIAPLDAKDVDDPGMETVTGNLKVRSKAGTVIVVRSVERPDEEADLPVDAISDFGDGEKVRVTKRTSPAAEMITNLVYGIARTKMNP